MSRTPAPMPEGCNRALLLIVTGILSFYAFRQWVAVDKTLEQIKAQTPAVLQSGAAAVSSAHTSATEAASSDANAQITLGEMKKQSTSVQILANATKTAAATAVKQLDLSERPLLVLTDTMVPWVVVNSFMMFSYDLNLLVKNKGRSPATNTALLSDLIIEVPGTTDSPRADMMTTCHRADKLGPLAGVMIPPDEKASSIKQTFLPPKKTLLRTALMKSVVTQSGIREVNGILVVCLLYRSPLSEQVHHTALMYELSLTFSSEEVAKIKSVSMTPGDSILLQSDRILLREMEIINGLFD